MVERKIKDIENGTVVDHIPAGKATRIIDALRIGGDVTLIAMNVSSKKMGKKDILKVENRFFSPEDAKKIALIAPNATINVIRNSKIVEKKRLGK